MDLEAFLAEWHNDSPTVLVHTSGSTGEPKPLLVEKRRMEASARITCSFLGLREGDTALLCLPLDYIAGKMMVVRSISCGLRLISVPPSSHPLRSVATPDGFPSGSAASATTPDGFPSGTSSSPSITFAAMVPLQVWNSLQVPEERERLMQIRHLIIGGGAIDDRLAQALAAFPNNVWSTYGMTETLSHIALRRLNGPDRSEWYTPFDGVSVSVNADGCLVIDAPAVCDGPLVTNDIAELDPQTLHFSPPFFEGQRLSPRFRILGRKDNVICSGGVKIQIEEVENLLKPHVRVPYIITKTLDERLGEQVVMLTESADIAALQDICREVLPKYWQPRRILTVDRLPLTATGKPARAEAERIAAATI